MAKGISDLVKLGEITAVNVIPPAPTKRGDKPIKRLTIKHRRMLALHLQGYSNIEIAASLECNPQTVGAIIRNPTSKILLERAYEEYQDRLKALIPLQVAAIRDGLIDNDPRVKLQAVDRHQSAMKEMGRGQGEVTAEDVIRRIIRIRNGEQEIVIAEERR